jgi:hypothetical protein
VGVPDVGSCPPPFFDERATTHLEVHGLTGCEQDPVGVDASKRPCRFDQIHIGVVAGLPLELGLVGRLLGFSLTVSFEHSVASVVRRPPATLGQPHTCHCGHPGTATVVQEVRTCGPEAGLRTVQAATFLSSDRRTKPPTISSTPMIRNQIPSSVASALTEFEGTAMTTMPATRLTTPNPMTQPR